MKKGLLLAVTAAAIAPAAFSADSTNQAEVESAWLAFKNARGEASLIQGDLEHPSANAVFRVIPDISQQALIEDKLQLGFDLFNEARLSRDGSIACSSCHIAMVGGVDRQPVSFGIGGARGELNAPTIFNAALNFRQFWDGRALTLQEQALGPIENPIEFGHDIDAALAMLASIPEYVAAFDSLYPDGITEANLGDAIAYYETMNFTGLDSPFLRQFEDASEPTSQQAIRGKQRFVEVGCASCHNGINLGGNSYQKLGVAAAWYGEDRPADAADNGLYGRTGRNNDLHVFKVPTLHNVANTGPWLHDGSITSLQQAVDQMAQKQLGRYLENRDIDDIVAFLRTLGDPRSLIGDCSASGSYAVTMECSVKRVTSNVAPASNESSALPGSAALARMHQQEYAAAINGATTAPARIQNEILRIRSAEVAHYDFLQFEHIEMLRHARALSFPPADLDPTQRDSYLAQAIELQKQAADYEFIIADFLQTQAIASSARANYLDLLNILSLDTDEKIRVLLSQAEQNVQRFYVESNADTQQEFDSATNALLASDLNPQLLKELQTQARLLKENVSRPAA